MHECRTHQSELADSVELTKVTGRDGEGCRVGGVKEWRSLWTLRVSDEFKKKQVRVTISFAKDNGGIPTAHLFMKDKTKRVTSRPMNIATNGAGISP